MTNNQPPQVMTEQQKAAAAWGGVGVSEFLSAIGIDSWGDFAAMCAALYSLILISDWLVKKWRSRQRRR